METGVRTRNMVPVMWWRESIQQEWARSLNHRMIIYESRLYPATKSSESGSNGRGAERPQAVPSSRSSESACQVGGMRDRGGDDQGGDGSRETVTTVWVREA